jgi:hypothetical protein
MHLSIFGLWVRIVPEINSDDNREIRLLVSRKKPREPGEERIFRRVFFVESRFFSEVSVVGVVH